MRRRPLRRHPCTYSHPANGSVAAPLCDGVGMKSHGGVACVGLPTPPCGVDLLGEVAGAKHQGSSWSPAGPEPHQVRMCGHHKVSGSAGKLKRQFHMRRADSGQWRVRNDATATFPREGEQGDEVLVDVGLCQADVVGEHSLNLGEQAVAEDKTEVGAVPRRGCQDADAVRLGVGRIWRHLGPRLVGGACERCGSSEQ